MVEALFVRYKKKKGGSEKSVCLALRVRVLSSEFAFKPIGLQDVTHFASTAVLLELAHVVKC